MSLKMHYGGDVKAGRSGVLVDSVSIDNLTIEAGGYASYSLSAGRSGYAPIGVVGYYIGPATDGGARYTYIAAHAVYLSGTDVIVEVRNHHTTANAKIKISVDVLYA